MLTPKTDFTAKLMVAICDSPKLRIGCRDGHSIRVIDRDTGARFDITPVHCIETPEAPKMQGFVTGDQAIRLINILMNSNTQVDANHVMSSETFDSCDQRQLRELRAEIEGGE